MIDDVPPHHRAALAAERHSLRRRRAIVAVTVTASILPLLLAILRVLGADGLQPLDIVLACLFGLTLPTLVIGFWNAAIGSAIGLLAADPAAAVCPALRRTPKAAAIASRTAVLVPAHNEEPQGLFRHLEAVWAGLQESDAAGAVSLFLLSDTSDPALALQEEHRFAAWRAKAPGSERLHYRRRPDNAGNKTGNMWEFLDRQGAEFDFALVLDADSLMSGAAVTRLIRVMQANPEIGILQQLTVGLPTAAPFARLFQVGMRHGMRVHSLGSAWWQGDGGPYWGHNAILRLAPFIAHCRLPLLPGPPPWGGRILSHDQVEALLMRRAGWEVRVLVEEEGSFELNPPTLLEFIKRDLRWGQGNLQYLNLLPRLKAPPLARLQLVLACMMYVTAPACLAFTLLAFGRAIVGGPGAGGALFEPWRWAALGQPQPFEPWLLLVVIQILVFAPKLIGAAAALLERGRAAAFAGRPRLVGSFCLELVFSIALAPVMLVAQTRLVLAMACGRTIAWDAQRRTRHALRWGEACRRFWQESAGGALLLVGVPIAAPQLWPWALLLGTPLLLTPLFAVATADARLGRWLIDAGFGATPEELCPPAIVERAGHVLTPAPSPAGRVGGERPPALVREIG